MQLIELKLENVDNKGIINYQWGIRMLQSEITSPLLLPPIMMDQIPLPSSCPSMLKYAA